MKAVKLVDLEGLFIEDMIESDMSFNGVVDTYTPTENEEGVIVDVHSGYKVGVPITFPFYLPKFQIDVWKDYLNLVYTYESQYKEWEDLGKEGDEPVKINIEDFNFWVEGLTRKEIEDMTPPTPPKTQLEILQEELTGTQIALSDVYEQLLLSQDETTGVQKALVDLYEQFLLFVEGGIQNG